MDDPIVQEVHEIRRRILEQCNGDLDCLIERLKAAESKDKDRLVTMEDVQERARVSKAGT
jgi:hypothetical protein